MVKKFLFLCLLAIGLSTTSCETPENETMSLAPMECMVDRYYYEACPHYNTWSFRHTYRHGDTIVNVTCNEVTFQLGEKQFSYDSARFKATNIGGADECYNVPLSVSLIHQEEQFQQGDSSRYMTMSYTRFTGGDNLQYEVKFDYKYNNEVGTLTFEHQDIYGGD